MLWQKLVIFLHGLSRETEFGEQIGGKTEIFFSFV